MKIKDLAVKHDYYASDSNYYSNECSFDYKCWEDFYKEMGDSDTDMNLVYRWDVHHVEDKDFYYMQIFVIGQRKGKYLVFTIELVEDKDVDSIVKYLNKSLKKLNNIWMPLSEA
jgi:phage terminase large subunit-like protein